MNGLKIEDDEPMVTVPKAYLEGLLETIHESSQVLFNIKTLLEGDIEKMQRNVAALDVSVTRRLGAIFQSVKEIKDGTIQ